MDKKFACAVIKVVEILGSLWFNIPAADSVEVEVGVKLNLTGLTATQSTTLTTKNASLAIDGNYNTDFGKGSCTHTQQNAVTNWWRVDLGHPVKVQRVVLVNRGDCCGNRMDNFVVGLSNISTNPVRGQYDVCGQYPGPTANGACLSLKCNPNTPPGRFVIVQQANDRVIQLTICEIEIYAGEVRNLNGWKRISNQRLMSVGAIILSKRSALMCVGKCQETIDCDSVNYHQMDKTCEMNFLPPGANCSHLAIAAGWDYWVQIYEFI